jgi:hypothetical protein
MSAQAAPVTPSHHTTVAATTVNGTPRSAASAPMRSMPANRYSHLTTLPRRGGTSANQESSNWSGYATEGGYYTTVSSNWVQPSVSCDNNGMVAFWVGLDGWGSSTVEQTGTAVDCSSGYPQYYAWWETYPADAMQPYYDTVEPGDSMSASVTDEGGNTYDLVLTDYTQGWTENNPQAGPAGASDASAEVIVEAPTADGSIVSLPDFGTASFTDSTIDGQTLPNAGAQAIDMVDGSGDVIASTGPSDSGGDFSVSYE